MLKSMVWVWIVVLLFAGVGCRSASKERLMEPTYVPRAVVMERPSAEHMNAISEWWADIENRTITVSYGFVAMGILVIAGVWQISSRFSRPRCGCGH